MRIHSTIPYLRHLLVASMLALASCGSDDEAGPIRAGKPGSGSAAASAKGVSVGGKDWKGVFYATDGVGRTSVSATVTQSGNAVTITTTRPAGGIGHRFTGTIDAAGNIRLTDARDGETWTTYYGPAHGNYMKIADFVDLKSVKNPRADLNVIELTRRGGSRPADVSTSAENTTRDAETKKPTTPVAPKPPSPPVPPAPVSGTPELPAPPTL